MKNKVKSILFSFGTFYMIIVVILMLFTYCNMKTNLELSSNDEYKNELKQYKEMINNLENSKCKNYMNTLVAKVEKDISVGEISLKDYYDNMIRNDSLLAYYAKASEECESITTEKMQEMNMPTKFLTPGIIGDEILNNYIYQYELSVLDKKTRDINETNLIPVENNIKANIELEIIKDLFANIDWEKEV